MWLKAGIDPAFPDVRGVEYLLDMMAPDGLGWCSFDQMGSADAVPWAEIVSFSEGAGLALEPWETRQIRAMSVAYVDGWVRGSEPMKVSPVFEQNPDDDPGVALERKRISETLNAAFSAMAGPQD